jgi:3'-5' exonuclease
MLSFQSVPRLPWIQPSFQGPAVVQIATPTSAMVIHLTRNSGRFCRSCQPLIESILEDERIVKAGCGVDMDMLELRDVFPTLEARSRFDLGTLRRHDNNMPGLKTLAACILDVDLPKSRKVSTSDWSQFPLSDFQIAYAARDAWAGAAVAAELELIDHGTFGYDALVDRLRVERPLTELHRRQRKRHRARSLLKALLRTNESRKARRRSVDLSLWKIELVRELRAVVQANKHVQVHDLERHGYRLSTIQKNSTLFRY